MNQSILSSPLHSTDSVFLRRRQLEVKTGYSRSTIYLRIQQGLLTKPVSLGAKAVGWPSCEVTILNNARIAGMADDGIRRLVQQLHNARPALMG